MIKVYKDSPGNCKNCVGNDGIHHYETKQCPKNGIEEIRYGKKQQWENTTFENEYWARLSDQSNEMLFVLQQCLILVADLNGSHFIPGKGDSNLDMIQRIKAMRPRIYNLIKPLQK